MHLIEHFYRILAPTRCIGCGAEGALICLWCRDDLLPAEASRCYRCNKLTKDNRTCQTCRRKSPLRHVFVRAEYTGSAKELVHRMKFSYSVEAADIIAQELTNTIPALPEDTLIVHIPTVTSHVRERGYDHALRIARGLAKRAHRLHAPALGRLGQHRQVGSKRADRLSKVKQAFRVTMPFTVKERPILLVDDVLTTGATLEAAAFTLKQAGAKSVDAIIFARAK